jgi:hypothetical protein
MGQGQQPGAIRHEPGSSEAAEPSRAQEAAEPTMSREAWLGEFCDRIGVEPPSRDEMGALLKLAATAAHASERPAAPLACWAAGRSGRPAAELQKIADSIAS